MNKILFSFTNIIETMKGGTERGRRGMIMIPDFTFITIL